MLAWFLAASLVATTPGTGLARQAAPHFALAQLAAPARPLRDVLMDRFHAMNAAEQGIFHQDISDVVAPYFPLGQSFAATKTMIKQQNLGILRPFKGDQPEPDGMMYVTRFSLMDAMFSDVYIVLDFDFEGRSEADMVLRKTSASIRAANM